MIRLMPTSNDAGSVPEGMHFLHLVWEEEDSCEASTDNLIPSLGEKGPACLEHIGTVLASLDRVSLRSWGCREEDHVVEYLCGRVASNARAALRLMRLGYYDECLSLCRGMGEAANLFQLFVADETAFEGWVECSRQERLREFSPVKVRQRLEAGDGALVNKDRYAALSDKFSHAQPKTRPQAHNPLGVPSLGAVVQQEGSLVCLNEIARPLAITAVFGSILLRLEGNVLALIKANSIALVESIGQADVLGIEDYYRDFRNSVPMEGTLSRSPPSAT
ncbi:MAG: hypothetical protein F4Y97_05205 [Dehalococcoidia bacterium]|nr:hypothetical protein [Dehalococcoidia bacterium]